MKSVVTLSLALLALVPTQAQVFGPQAGRGMFWGGMAGAIIGNSSGSLGHNAWRGAAYGAGVGLLFGAMADRDYYCRTAVQVPNPAYYYPRTYVYRSAPAGYYYDEPAYANEVSYERPNYAANGLLLGALTGAIIGNNSGSLGHNGWRGAAYGAGAGLLLGSIAEHNARQREAAVATQVVPATVAPAPAPAVAPAPATPATSMSSANALFGRN